MKTQSARLSAVLLLNLAMIAGLILVGLSSHSLGVLAAGGDYVADSAGLGLGLLAIHLRDTDKKFSKATTLVALINAVFLFVVTAFVLYGAVHRLVTHTPVIDALPVMAVSVIATVVMLIGAKILGDDAGKEDLHMRSVLLDTLSDAASSGAIVITGGIILITKRFYWLDSVAALAIGLVIGYGSLKLLRDVVLSLRNPGSRTNEAIQSVTREE